MILDCLDLEQIKFKLELKTEFKIVPPSYFYNCVTQPCINLLCDWLLFIWFCLPALCNVIILLQKDGKMDLSGLSHTWSHKTLHTRAKTKPIL